MICNSESFNDDYWSKHNTEKLESHHKLALRMLSDYRIKSVLDVGCGNGVFLQEVKAENKLGIDTSDEAIKLTSDKRIMARKPESINESAVSFSCVTFLDVIEHTLMPSQMIKHWMKAADKGLITTPNFSFIKYRIQCFFGNVPDIWREKKGHMFWFTKRKLEEVVKEADCEIAVWDYIYPLENKLFGKIIKLVLSLCPSLFATEYGIIIQKIGGGE